MPEGLGIKNERRRSNLSFDDCMHRRKVRSEKETVKPKAALISSFLIMLSPPGRRRGFTLPQVPLLSALIRIFAALAYLTAMRRAAFEPCISTRGTKVPAVPVIRRSKGWESFSSTTTKTPSTRGGNGDKVPR
jgi:hypothetical protein